MVSPERPQSKSAEVVTPTTSEEVSSLLAEAFSQGGRLAVEGGGTKSAWGGALEAVDLVCSTASLTDLIFHARDDLTVAAQAGMPLSVLQGILEPHGQWLAVDPPERPGATLGGVFASADGGPRWLRYGSIRNLVIGVTFVLSDGTLSRSGGRVIKNVAGYDLGKLLCGSYGTLGVVTELTLRLQPLSEASRSVLVRCSPTEAYEAYRVALEGPSDPSAIEWCKGRLLVRVEGTSDGAPSRAEALALELSAFGPEIISGKEEQVAWGESAASRVASEKDSELSVARAATLPGRFPDVVAAFDDLASGMGQACAAELASDMGSGLHDAILRGPSSAVAGFVGAWRERIWGLGGTVVLKDHPRELDELVDPWGFPPPARDVMAAVKSSLDPKGSLSPGRFAPWW